MMSTLCGEKLHCSVHAGYNGVGFYRSIAPTMTMASMFRNKYKFCESSSSIHDDYYLKFCDSFRVQRLYTSSVKEWYLYLLEKAKEANFPIIYDVDDILIYEDIPAYNWRRPGFYNSASNVFFYMEHADKITVTNNFLANYYSNKLDIPISKFIIIPNYLPKWWYGSQYNLDKSLNNYKKFKKKPRIVFCCDRSHVDYDFFNNGVDDFTEISDWIIQNRFNYQFVFVGCIPMSVKKFAQNFEICSGTDILQYPNYRASLNASLYIQPLQHSLFNYCKSNIKQLEAWADGVPILTQDTPNYTAFDERNCFSNADDLNNKVETFFKNMSLYKNTVIENRKKLNSFWLENNINKWEKVLNER